jgi:calcineurin-like phosphoesterase family protein
MTEFVISDMHLGHSAVWERFKRDDGTPLRPFTDTEEMHEVLVERWNAKVKPNDVVYNLGDVALKKSALPVLSRLNGSMRLIMGNHEIYGHKTYLQYFHDVVAYRHVRDKFLLSHIPVHASELSRWGANVHGHLHDKEVMDPTTCRPDARYLCVSVEQTDYAPLAFEEVEARIAARQS